MELTNLIEESEKLALSDRLNAVNEQIKQIDAVISDGLTFNMYLVALDAKISLNTLKTKILVRMAFINSHFSKN